MTDIKPRKTWAVVGPDGNVGYVSICIDADVCWRDYLAEGPHNRQFWKQKGYTVQPVMITGRKG